MSKISKVIKDTGKVIKKFTKDHPHDSVGLDLSPQIIQNYDFAYDPESRDLIVVATDKEDREAYIQSFASECGVYNIMKMYAKTGDMSLLSRKVGFYGDISDIPEDELNPAAYKDQAEKAVASLAKTLGAEFSVDEFAAMSDAELADLIDKAVQAKAQKVEKKEGAE